MKKLIKTKKKKRKKLKGLACDNTIEIELQTTIHRQPSTLFFCAFDSRYELEIFAPASGEKHVQ